MTEPVEEEVVRLDIPPAVAERISSVVGAARTRIGARLATVSLWRPATSDLVRVYSSEPAIYRPGGISAGLGAEWIRQCVIDQQSFLADDEEAMTSDAFEHHGVLASLGLSSAINAVIARDGVFLGVLNLLDAAGVYTAESVVDSEGFAAELVDALASLMSGD